MVPRGYSWLCAEERPIVVLRDFNQAQLDARPYSPIPPLFCGGRVVPYLAILGLFLALWS